NRHNLVICSRWPIRAQEALYHRLVPPPVLATETGEVPVAASWDRPVLHAAIALPQGQVVHVLNLHLRPPLASHLPGEKGQAGSCNTTKAWAAGSFLSSVKRAGQAMEARLLIEYLLDEDAEALIAVAGATNSGTLEMPVRLLCAGTGDTGNGALA